MRSRNVDAAADDDDDEDEDEPEERAAPRRRAARDIMATDERISSTKGTKRFPPGSEPEFSREVVYPFTDAESESSSRVGSEKGLLERWAEGTREARERETVAAERWPKRRRRRDVDEELTRACSEFSSSSTAA